MIFHVLGHLNDYGLIVYVPCPSMLCSSTKKIKATHKIPSCFSVLLYCSHNPLSTAPQQLSLSVALSLSPTLPLLPPLSLPLSPSLSLSLSPSLSPSLFLPPPLFLSLSPPSL